MNPGRDNPKAIHKTIGIIGTAVSGNMGGSVNGNPKKSLRSFSVYNGNAAVRYLQFFAQPGTPADQTVPTTVFTLPIGAVLSIPATHFGESGQEWAAGLAWGISTTKGTFTAATPADHNGHIDYR